MTIDMVYPPFLVENNGKQAIPIVVSSPHSGSFYPERLFNMTDWKLSDFQKCEDAAVDKLFSFAPAMGIPLISAVYGRMWVDLNRHPLELDPDLFSDDLPAQAQTDSFRVKNGFGVIPRKMDADTLIYPKKLLFATEQERLTKIHIPYHAALNDLMKKTFYRYDRALLLDVHSMPDLPTNRLVKGRMPDFVLGNLDNRSCRPEIMLKSAEILRDLGFFVTINTPYSGAYTTACYGHPDKRVHALQIEIARSLYWNKKTSAPSENFNALWRKLSLFMQRLAESLSDLPL